MDVARYFARRGARASAHYVVGRDGSVAQCVSLQDTAWHAGGGSFPLNGFGPLEKPVTGRFNRRSIGIEMCNVGWATERFGIPEEGTLDATHPATPSRVQTWERYTAVQIEALATVVQWAVWSCPGLRWVVGHEDVVNRDTLGRVGGKTDPGPAFPWGDVPWSSFGLTRVRYDYLEKAWVTDED
jgi:N-acetylmuramoyl-L-alanine amidase